MQEAIQPKYYQAKVKCNCGNEFTIGSTQEEIRVEVCSKCHPFYTGNQKNLNDAGGRVENFHKSRPMVCHRSFFVPILIFKIASYTHFRISGIVNVDKLKIFDFILKMDLYTMENKVLKNCA